MTGSRKPNKHRGVNKMNSFRASKYKVALARLRDQRRQLETERRELEVREENADAWERLQEQRDQTSVSVLTGSTLETTLKAPEDVEDDDYVVVEKQKEHEQPLATASDRSNGVGSASVDGSDSLDGEAQHSAGTEPTAGSDESAPNGAESDGGDSWFRRLF